LDDQAINAQELSHQTVAKLQAQLEARVQKDLDQLTLLQTTNMLEVSMFMTTNSLD